jgi:holo-[acyl-carrier protein] synthase
MSPKATKRTRRQFTPEFKAAAALATDERAELTRLRREVRALERERDLVNKARLASRIVGLGMDIVELAEFEASVASRLNVVRRVFTEGELAYAGAGVRRLERLAARFAAKEAALKAVGIGWSKGVSWLDAEVVAGPPGSPRLIAHRALRRHARARGGVAFQLSRSRRAQRRCTIQLDDRQRSKPRRDPRPQCRIDNDRAAGQRAQQRRESLTRHRDIERREHAASLQHAQHGCHHGRMIARQDRDAVAPRAAQLAKQRGEAVRAPGQLAECRRALRRTQRCARPGAVRYAVEAMMNRDHGSRFIRTRASRNRSPGHQASTGVSCDP